SLAVADTGRAPDQTRRQSQRAILSNSSSDNSSRFASGFMRMTKVQAVFVLLIRRHLERCGQFGAELLLELGLRIGEELLSEVVVLLRQGDDLRVKMFARHRLCHTPDSGRRLDEQREKDSIDGSSVYRARIVDAPGRWRLPLG